MNQSAVLKASYEAVYKILSDLAIKTKLFRMGAGGALEAPKDEAQPSVCLGVSDVSQLFIDKNGQTVEMDEMMFEAPTQVGCMLYLTIISKYYPHLLETAGALIQYFKDNNSILLEDYKWHGEEGKVIIEPVVRDLDPHKDPLFYQEMPAITIKYHTV